MQIKAELHTPDSTTCGQSAVFRKRVHRPADALGQRQKILSGLNSMSVEFGCARSQSHARGVRVKYLRTINAFRNGKHEPACEPRQ